MLVPRLRLIFSLQWIFLNSSISEGLPLALGEAALTGAPVVCTDVGASLRVFIDPSSGKRYGSLVAPNDVVSLARGQVSMLALLEEFSEFAGDEEGYHPKLPPNPTKEEVQQIQKRMYEKSEQRRALGMLSRSLVIKSFSPERYLREHEQMLWIGKYQSKSYRARFNAQNSTDSSGNSTYSTVKSTLRGSSVMSTFPDSSGISTLRDSSGMSTLRDSSCISMLRDGTGKSFRDSSAMSSLRNVSGPLNEV
jgi:Glycosyl transferases group 1